LRFDVLDTMNLTEFLDNLTDTMAPVCEELNFSVMDGSLLSRSRRRAMRVLRLDAMNIVLVGVIDRNPTAVVHAVVAGRPNPAPVAPNFYAMVST